MFEDDLGGVYHESFGKRLAAVRKRAGLTQSELAERMDISSPETISRYERDEREPRVTVLLQLGTALNVSPRSLLPALVNSKDRVGWLNDIYEVLIDNGGFDMADADYLINLISTVTEGLTSLGRGPYEITNPSR